MTLEEPPLRPPGDRESAPASLPAPPALEGISWRGLDRLDLPALAALVAACEEHDDPPYRTSEEELAEDLFDGSACDPDVNTIAGVTADGALVAYARVRALPGHEVNVRVFLGGGVHPEVRRRGVGTGLVAWQVARARQLLAELHPQVPARIATYVEDGMGDQEALLRRAGFEPRRYYTELRRDLALPIPATTIAASLRVEPWTQELDDQVRQAHNEAFADHWDAEPQTPEAWQEGNSHFAPEWSFVVMDRSTDRVRIAGYLLSGRYEQDWPAFGYTVGYTDLLGVRREWRGRRVATALLTTAMRAYAADGMQYAALGVDTESRTGAFGLYEGLGYVPTRGSVLWSIEV